MKECVDMIVYLIKDIILPPSELTDTEIQKCRNIWNKTNYPSKDANLDSRVKWWTTILHKTRDSICALMITFL